ncbi:hypothetical protein DY000_02000065 [Brassica cretica]|uniref:Uncharacterized protein n=1 Tax=Brassica cretica TaxID=69181 RepID=A0ABQ7CJ23_BRACR|nr:hypothetical protein DY000_02000065 [Brassica cretica]
MMLMTFNDVIKRHKLVVACIISQRKGSGSVWKHQHGNGSGYAEAEAYGSAEARFFEKLGSGEGIPSCIPCYSLMKFLEKEYNRAISPINLAIAEQVPQQPPTTPIMTMKIQIPI